MQHDSQEIVNEVLMVHTVGGNDDIVVPLETLQLFRNCPVQFLNLHTATGSYLNYSKGTQQSEE